ncbi:MAG TPA: DUF4339 domain-containing protein [Micropepsaceae bacterium]|nr:DUF4339 domain-containing protein [Micropepsaceae bacterium]
MSGAWTINVGGTVYGPFSQERMRSFASEGRLAAGSLVARENESDWHQAHEEPAFADLFASTEMAAPFADRAGASQTRVATPNATPAAAHSAQPEVPRAHFTIVVDLKSRGVNFEHALASLGTFYQLVSNVWILASDQSVGAVRNRLVQELGKSDSLFVVDSSRNRAAWFNFGPDADAHIRQVWQKTN